MAAVFEEDAEAPSLSDAYLERLLANPAFWALAAFEGKDIVGGITAHVLPMTRVEASELFVYDLAVREDYQRKGIGRRLMTTLHEAAQAEGIQIMFVPADNEDGHALDFYRAIGGDPAPVTIFTFGADDA
jgi:aminoglycoside 3-N-acetyltransferase I